MSVRVAVFASGGGTNLQALLDHFHGGRRGAAVALVVSDRADAGALERAARAGVPGRVVPVAGRPAAVLAAETLDALDGAATELVALAGYTRLVPEDVVRRFAGRIVNVHPALLPAFGGKGMYGARVHRAVLAAGCAVTGPTVHLVNERYDEGRILAQWPVPVLEGDSPASLAARVLRAEHALYPATVEWLASVLSEAPPDAVAAVARALSLRSVREAAFRWAEEGSADETGIRRMLGLD
ncbi:MAG TPA: phosphoribosylglycinamide formyltransferase [Longimicrobiales bacterium]|nr:phosphoribosylglycinamide formyltransferase [Longimicrobiales bacterium]